MRTHKAQKMMNISLKQCTGIIIGAFVDFSPGTDFRKQTVIADSRVDLIVTCPNIAVGTLSITLGRRRDHRGQEVYKPDMIVKLSTLTSHHAHPTLRGVEVFKSLMYLRDRLRTELHGHTITDHERRAVRLVGASA